MATQKRVLSEDEKKWRHTLKKDEKLDVLDTEDKWCFAEVLQLDNTTDPDQPKVKIHYFGWESKWDEYIDLYSPRLAPPRSKTSGDTGKEAAHKLLKQQQQQQPPQQPPPQQPPPQQQPTSEDMQFRRNLATGDIVDIFDTSDRVWRAAEVVSHSSREISVRYMEKMGQTWLNRDNERIAPPFTKSVSSAPKTAQPVQQPPAPAGSVGGAASQGAVGSTSSVSAAGPIGGPADPGYPGSSRGELVLKKGNLVDCFDNADRTWRLAEVINVRRDEVYIHYEGWGPQWDEWIPQDSSRLAPPRTKTTGDTGPSARKKSQQNNYNRMDEVYQMPTFRPSYECTGSCKWKRILSTGINNNDLNLLNSLFEKCCSLQDDVQDELLSQRPSPEFKKKLSNLETLINEVKEKITKDSSSPASFYVSLCSRIFDAIKDSHEEAEQTLKRQGLQQSEELYMNKLRNNFAFVEIPSDGNCLFAAVGRCNELKSRFLDLAKKDSRENVGSLVSALRNVNKELNLEQSLKYRHLAITQLKQDQSFHKAIKNEVRDALARGEGGNRTIKEICKEMKKKFPTNTVEACDSDEALNIYTQVMGSEGIYGTLLEVEALSAALQTPIHLYFRDSEGEPTTPTRVIGAKYTTNPPICLAFYMAQQHYKLLVPLSPADYHAHSLKLTAHHLAKEEKDAKNLSEILSDEKKDSVNNNNPENKDKEGKEGKEEKKEKPEGLLSLSPSSPSSSSSTSTSSPSTSSSSPDSKSQLINVPSLSSPPLDLNDIEVYFEWAVSPHAYVSTPFRRRIRLDVPFNVFLEQLAMESKFDTSIQIEIRRSKTQQKFDPYQLPSQINPPLEPQEVFQLFAVGVTHA